MIVSASYKTDIPAFYSTWFMARLDAGACRMVNPYGAQVTEVALTRARVDGLVFWTRNAGPFLPALDEIRQRGFPFIVQFTLTGYPRALEPSVIATARGIEQIQTLAKHFGPRAVVWRYDPILVSDLTPIEAHAERFRRLAARLAGTVDEVVISWAQIYRKTERNLDAAARRHGFAWRDPDPAEKRDLVAELARIARDRGMRLSLCAQPDYLVPGAAAARCIDAERLGDVAGYKIEAPTKGNRPGCLCAESRDIGAYDSCAQGCVYCYAVNSGAAVKRRRAEHDPAGEFLIEPKRKEASREEG